MTTTEAAREARMDFMIAVERLLKAAEEARRRRDRVLEIQREADEMEPPAEGDST
jgi:hypothetical protein